MVIVCHTTYSYSGLPWPVRRITTTGWFGVQLFFVASAITLLMSWQAQEHSGSRDTRAYAIRRLFRIAPAYYLAAILYFFVFPPAKFSWVVLLSTLTFTNGWSPELLSAPNAWIVVPGGWSISVEMSFYIIFPLYAVWAINLRRAIMALLSATLLGIGANLVSVNLFGGIQAKPWLGNFLFFWLPNQLSIFALGGVLYHLLPHAKSSRLLRQFGPIIALGSVAAFCALAYLPGPHYLGDGWGIPSGHASTLVLSLFVLTLFVRGGLFHNHIIAALGRVSFSAYLIHWAALKALELAPDWFGLNATGVNAIIKFSVGLLIIILVTYTFALVGFYLVEQPMIRFGKRLISSLPPKRVNVQPAS